MGGDDFDNILIDYCIQKFEKEYYTKINKDTDAGKLALRRLKNACEEVKKILSTKIEHRIDIQSLYGNDDLNLPITRSQFEFKCKGNLKKLLEPIEKSLKISGFSKDKINEILLVGGSTRIPKIKEIIQEYFGEKTKINNAINPDEVVAYGATLQAAICMKEKSLNDVIIYDICSHSIGTDIVGDDKNADNVCDILIKNGTVIPFETEQIYYTSHDNQTSVSVQIYEGEEKFCKDNRWLGGFYLNNIHSVKGIKTKINMKISIDENSIIHAYVEEKISGENKSIDIKYDNGILRKEELEEVERRLKYKDNFEKSVYNQEEKELNKMKISLRDEFLNIGSIKSFIELIKIQEKLVEISLNNHNQNNFDKKFSNIKYLFKYYNYIFTNYTKYSKIGNSDNYVLRIKKYLDIFKNFQPFFIKSSVLIFQDDNNRERISEIIMYHIQLIKKYIYQTEKKKYIAYYYEDILDIINKFEKQINKSNFKKEFETIKFECKKNREKSLNIGPIQNWDKKVGIEKAIIEIDHLSLCIENFKYSECSEKSRKYEKAFRAFMLARLSHLELQYFSNFQLSKIEKYINESLSLVKELKLTDDWIKYLVRNKEIIEQKKHEKKLEETTKINGYMNWLDRIKNTKINGEDNETNIQFFEFLFENEIKDKWQAFIQY